MQKCNKEASDREVSSKGAPENETASVVGDSVEHNDADCEKSVSKSVCS